MGNSLNLLEELSRLMDDDLPEKRKEELIELLLHDKEARDTWYRYQTTRNALHNKLKPGESMVDRVRKVIDKENHYQKTKEEKE